MPTSSFKTRNVWAELNKGNILQDSIVIKEPPFLLCGVFCIVGRRVEERQDVPLCRDTVNLVKLPLLGRSN